MSNELEFTAYQPGCLSQLCAMQSAYYAKHWGFDHIYESVVATGVADFLQRYQPDQDFIRLVIQQQQIKGGIVIDSRDGKLAQLRWFILQGELQGSGAGKALIQQAMQFVKQQGFAQVYLTTFDGLAAARHLYEQAGFRLEQEQMANSWGREVKEQRLLWQA